MSLRFGVLGTGMVGTALAGKLIELGHEVTMGARESGNEKALAWAGEHGERAHQSAFEGAAAFGEILLNATAGSLRWRRSSRRARRTSRARS